MDQGILKAIEQAKNGEEAGFNYLYAQTHNLVYFHARGYLKNEEDVHDLVQNVYIAVYRNIHTLENPEAFFGWLKMVVRNQAGMILRKFKDDVPLEEGFEEFQGIDTWAATDVSTLPEASAEQKALAEILLEMMNGLPELQKTALMMQVYEQMTEKEIAEALDCPLGTVKSRLRYAKAYLKEQVEAREKKDGIRLHAVGIPALLACAYKLLSEEPETVMAAESAYREICSSVGLSVAEMSKEGAATVAETVAETVTESVTGTTGTMAAGKTATVIKEIAGISKKAKLLLLTGTLAVGGGSAAVGATVGAEAIVEQKMEAFYEEMEESHEDNGDFPSDIFPATPTPTNVPTPTSTPYVMTEEEKETLENIRYEIRDKEAVILGAKDKTTLTKLILPEMIEECPVTEIVTEAFMECEVLEKVVLPDTIEYVGDSAFAWCKKLCEITLSKNLRVIGNSTFWYCGQLTTVNIPEGVTALGAFAFGNTGIRQIAIPESVVKIDQAVFGNTTVIFFDAPAGSYAEEWAKDVGLVSNQKDTEVAPVFTYTVVDNQAIITGMDKIKWDYLVIPEQIDGYPVTEIAADAFAGCELKWIDIPASVKRICVDAFMTENYATGIRFHGNETKLDGVPFRFNKKSSGSEVPVVVVPEGSETEKWVERLTDKKIEVIIY